MTEVYITNTSSFLPNDPVENEEIEDILGKIGGNASKAKNLILKKNQIKTRYYAYNKEGKLVYTNAEMTAAAVRKLFDDKFDPKKLEVLSCGTSSPDQMIPSHASMVHGILKETASPQIFSPSGVCASGMQALWLSYLSIKSDMTKNAICTGSELASPIFKSDFFETEYNKLLELKSKPKIAFEKDFLRFMLSDGAGAFLLSETPTSTINFKIDWIESFSFANEYQVCMYMGCDLDEEQNVLPWRSISVPKWAETSVFAVKQNAALVEEAIPSSTRALLLSAKKHPIDYEKIDHFLPHISSMYFYDKLMKDYSDNGINIPESAWYVPLPKVGNIGSASIYVALDELKKNKELKEGEKILLMIPESARFHFFYVMLTVVRKD